MPLERAGIEIVDADPCDLIVAPASAVVAAAASSAPFVILVGSVGPRRLRRAGLRGERVLPMPSLDQPSLLIPVDRSGPASYALSQLTLPPTRAKQLRNRLIARAIAARVRLPRVVTLASRDGAPPPLIAAGVRLGLPEEIEWVLSLGRTTVERGVFHVLRIGESRPSWVLKFVRGKLNADKHLTDTIGLGMIASVGGNVAERAPRLIGTGEVEGCPIVVETAAVGSPLGDLLRTGMSPAEKRRLIDAVAQWLVDLGAASRREPVPTESLPGIQTAAEVAREMNLDLTPLVAALPMLSPVLEHGDVGVEHVISDGSGFVVVDWETATPNGLPLADLAYFMAQALPLLEGQTDAPDYRLETAVAALFRGESAASPILFDWLERARTALGLPSGSIGPLLSIVWLRVAAEELWREVAAAWFADPGLGPAWDIPRRRDHSTAEAST